MISDDEDDFDDEEVSAALSSLGDNLTDVIVKSQVIVKDVNAHPVFDVVFIGENNTARTRAFRFDVLRKFEEQCRPELGSSFVASNVVFPPTLSSSAFGFKLNAGRVEERRNGLEIWINNLLLLIPQMSEALVLATGALFQLEQCQLIGGASTGDDAAALGQRRGEVAPKRPIYTAGYLSKEGHAVRNWKRRYFVLDPESLPESTSTDGGGEAPTVTLQYFASEEAASRFRQQDASRSRGSSLQADGNLDASDHSGSAARLSKALSMMGGGGARGGGRPSFSRRSPSISDSGHNVRSSFSLSRSLSSFSMGARESEGPSSSAGDPACAPLGTIDLDGASIFFSAGDTDFTVQTKSGKMFPLRASNGAERTQWATSIRSAVLALSSLTPQAGAADASSACVSSQGGGGEHDELGEDVEVYEEGGLDRCSNVHLHELSDLFVKEVVSLLMKDYGGGGVTAASIKALFELGVRNKADLLDPQLCGDPMLLSLEVGMTPAELVTFRKAVATISVTPPPTTGGGDKGEESDADDFLAELERQEHKGGAGATAASPPSVTEPTERPFVARARAAAEANKSYVGSKILMRDLSKGSEKSTALQLDPAAFARFYACVKPALKAPPPPAASSAKKNGDDLVGCLAISASDYDEFKPFFDRVVIDLHRDASKGKQKHAVGDATWVVGVEAASGGDGQTAGAAPESLNLIDAGLGALDTTAAATAPRFVFSVRRNLNAFPLSGALAGPSSEMPRLSLEAAVVKGFAAVSEALAGGLGDLVAGDGGSVCFSLTPPSGWGNKAGKGGNSVEQPTGNTFMDFQAVDRTALLSALSKTDAGVLGGHTSAVESLDPAVCGAVVLQGRGVFMSQGGLVCGRYGFDDHLILTVTSKPGATDVGSAFASLQSLLKIFEEAAAAPQQSALKFTTHLRFGYVTSSPAHLGTALDAKVIGLSVPKLLAKYSTEFVREKFESHGILVTPSSTTQGLLSAATLVAPLESAAEATSPGGSASFPVRSSVQAECVDLCSTRTMFIREAEIAQRLFKGVSYLLKVESEADVAPVEDEEPLPSAADGDYDASISPIQANAAPGNGGGGKVEVGGGMGGKKGSSVKKMDLEISRMSALERTKTLADFKQKLGDGFQVIKFDRRGNLGFRTLLLVGGNLTWMKEGQTGKSSKLARKGGSARELIDLATMSALVLGEEPDPEAQEGEKLLGTTVLRMHVKKRNEVAAMRDARRCVSICFTGRTVDIGVDNHALRDFIAIGFKLALLDAQK